MVEDGDAALRRVRSAAQLLDGVTGRAPADVVRRLLGVQAQDLAWARLALRARGVPRAVEVDRALTEDRSLVLGWLMRGTLHLVAAEDYGWLLALTAPGRLTGNLRRLAQEGVSPTDAERALDIIRTAVRTEGPLTRTALAERIARADIPTQGQAMPHLLLYAALHGTIVAGPLHNGHPAYADTPTWLNPTPQPPTAPNPAPATTGEPSPTAARGPSSTAGRREPSPTTDGGLSSTAGRRGPSPRADGEPSSTAGRREPSPTTGGEPSSTTGRRGPSSSAGGEPLPGAGGEPSHASSRELRVLMGGEIRPLSEDERGLALACLAWRYLAGHGPATERDLATWSGLPFRDARAGLSAIAAETTRDPDGLIRLTDHPPSPPSLSAPSPPSLSASSPHGSLQPSPRGPSEPGVPPPPPRLLPAYDPYLLGWQDRGFAVPAAYAKRVHPGGGTLRAVATDQGEAVATWSIRRGAAGPQITLEPFAALPAATANALEAEATAIHHFETRP